MGDFILNDKRRRASALIMKYYSGMIDEGGWRHVSGDIAVFNTKYRRDLKSLIVQLEPIQAGSGDPSPDNIRPISGWPGTTITRTGKNILNPDLYGKPLPFSAAGITYTKIRDGLYHASGTSTSSAYFNVTYVSGLSSAMPCKNFCGMPITMTVFGTNKIIPSLGYFRDNGSYTSLNNGHILPDDAVAFRCYVRVNPNIEIDDDFSVQIEIGSRATPYEPYAGTIIPVSWETEVGAVYGGELDVVSGALTVDRAMTGIGDLQWSYMTNYRYFSTSTLIDVIAAPISNQIPLDHLLCTTYKTASAQAAGSGGVDLSIAVDTYKAVLIKDLAYTDVNTWITARANQMIVYPIATPVTYQLTPQQIQTLVGENVIWSDAGPVSVEYWS